MKRENVTLLLLALVALALFYAAWHKQKNMPKEYRQPASPKPGSVPAPAS